MSDPIDELRDAIAAMRTHSDQRLAEIAQNGAPRAETQKALDRASEAVTTLTERLDAGDVARAEQAARIQEMENRLNRPQAGGLRRGDVDDERMERYAAWQGAVQARALERGKPIDGLGTDTEVDPAHVNLEFIGAYRQATLDYFKHGKDGAAVDSLRVLNAALAGDNPSGGYYVDPDTNGRLVQFVYETSPVRQHANAQITSGDRLTGRVQLGEAGSGWVGETETRPATASPSVSEWEIPLREQYAMPEATQRIIDLASISIASWFEGNVRRKLARDEATAFVSGNTPKRPRGFTTYAAGTPGSTAATWPFIEQVNSGAAATLTADGLQNLVGAMKEEYLANARFGMRRATETVIRQMKDGNGNYLLVPDFANPARSTILGYPNTIMSDMPAIAASAEPVVFADFFEAYQIADSPLGARVLVDPFTNKPYVRFYTTRYVGGDVVNFEAIKLQTCSA